MKVAIHQPNFLPWLGYFSKISQADVFVFLDTVKCSKNSVFNRNKFSSKKGEDWFWLTVPLTKESYHQDLKDVVVDSNFLQKHRKFFEYDHLKNSKETDLIKSIISFYNDHKKDRQIRLCEFNISLIRLIADCLGLKTKIVLASDLEKYEDLKKQDLIIDIVKKLGGTVYISGTGAQSYQDEKSFIEQGIELRYDRFNSHESLMVNNENMSIVDNFLREDACSLRKFLISP